VCERFHKWPEEFKALPPDDQVRLLAYDGVRMEEIAQARAAENKAIKEQFK
jgi:hypothetical protein